MTDLRRPQLDRHNFEKMLLKFHTQFSGAYHDALKGLDSIAESKPELKNALGIVKLFIASMNSIHEQQIETIKHDLGYGLKFWAKQTEGQEKSIKTRRGNAVLRHGFWIARAKEIRQRHGDLSLLEISKRIYEEIQDDPYSFYHNNEILDRHVPRGHTGIYGVLLEHKKDL
jgi:hypothetical protein